MSRIPSDGSIGDEGSMGGKNSCDVVTKGYGTRCTTDPCGGKSAGSVSGLSIELFPRSSSSGPCMLTKGNASSSLSDMALFLAAKLGGQ